MIRNRHKHYLLTISLALMCIFHSSKIFSIEQKFVFPEYQFLRYNENWSILKFASPQEKRSDFWNPIKYIPFGTNNQGWITFGARLRARPEYWQGFDFLPNSDTFSLFRILLDSDIHFNQQLRLYVQGKSALSTKRTLPGGTRKLDVDQIALQQAFFDININLPHQGELILRPGRQEFSFGAQRLVSPLPWGNTMRTWDGGSAIVTYNNFTTTAFASKFVPVKKYQFNTADSIQFDGLYSTLTFPKINMGVDLYWLYYIDSKGVFNGIAGRNHTHTIGTRFFSGKKLNAFIYDIETAFQFGTLANRTICAYMTVISLGYPFDTIKNKPTIKVGFDYASGGDPKNKIFRTFNQLFPLGHAYFGYIDVIGRQNITEVHEGLYLHPTSAITTGISYHYFWRSSTQDALYNAGGMIVRRGDLGTAKAVGSEIDTTINYNIGRHFQTLFGYSHFFPGLFVQQSGSAKAIDFVYLQLIYII